jgi:hypothetical protein
MSTAVYSKISIRQADGIAQIFTNITNDISTCMLTHYKKIPDIANPIAIAISHNKKDIYAMVKEVFSFVDDPSYIFIDIIPHTLVAVTEDGEPVTINIPQKEEYNLATMRKSPEQIEDIKKKCSKILSNDRRRLNNILC